MSETRNLTLIVKGCNEKCERHLHSENTEIFLSRFISTRKKAKQGLLESKKKTEGNQAFFFFKDSRGSIKKENTLYSSIFFSFLRIIALDYL